MEKKYMIAKLPANVINESNAIKILGGQSNIFNKVKIIFTHLSLLKMKIFK